eukprot:TRINITY_DN44789_c0_g1_i1.p1 TRINITY_DN44789_c0_g1~~TRINITY_DN44789_c0_g1_i1.p1  ORF type:complete len:198 (+),score=26.18 TRINITY_DN44789_c0_g1_i1:271-864(+)
MNTLSRKLRSSSGDDDDHQGSLPTRDDSHPIDTQEQEELVRSFERKHEQQSFVWRSVFSTLLLSFTAFLVFSSFHQTLWPWELRYHAYFMDEVESLHLVSAESIAVIACMMAARGLLHLNPKISQQLMWYSCYISVLLAIFWFLHMLRMPKFHWDVIWLPLGPLSGAGISLYVDHLFADSLGEIRKLRGSMYSYKSS